MNDMQTIAVAIPFADYVILKQNGANFTAICRYALRRQARKVRRETIEIPDTQPGVWGER